MFNFSLSGDLHRYSFISFSISSFNLSRSMLSIPMAGRKRTSLSTFYLLQQIELDELNRTQQELKQGSEKLQDILQKLEREQVNDYNRTKEKIIISQQRTCHGVSCCDQCTNNSKPHLKRLKRVFSCACFYCLHHLGIQIFIKDACATS